MPARLMMEAHPRQTYPYQSGCQTCWLKRRLLVIELIS